MLKLRISATRCMSFALTTAFAGPLAAAEPTIPTYEATYGFEYEGKERGSSEFSVSYDAARDVYVFSSVTKAKGLLVRAVAPNPIVERSEFRVVNGALQPLSFRYEDGSRKGDDNYSIEFDWANGKAIVTRDGVRREFDVEPGTLDRGTMQVALMHDMAAGRVPGRYRLVDDDSVQAYDNRDNGTENIATGVGELAARSVTQQREGSSRTNWLWLAPTLEHLPVRIEQRRDGEVKMAFTLQSVAGLP
jgi:hypothetical protein